MTASLMTPQAAGTSQWFADVGKLLEKLGCSFSDLRESTQRELLGHTQDIARLSDDFSEVKQRFAERFRALADGQVQGRLKHGFSSNEHARAFGESIIAMRNRDAAKLTELQKMALLPTSGSEGGYLLVETLVADIMRELDQYGVFLADCPPMPVDSPSGGSPRGTGGFTLRHPKYAGTPVVSSPTIGNTLFELLRYVACGEIEQWMLKSNLAISLAEYIRQEIAYCLEAGTDAEWFMGDGTEAYGKYIGLFKLTGSATVSASQPTVVTGDSGDDTFVKVIAKTTYYLASMLGLLPEWAHRAGPSWYMHPLVFFSYMGVRDSEGMPITNIYIGDGPQLRLMGLPVRLCCGAPSVTAVSTVFALATCLKRSCRTYRHNQAIEIAWSDNLGEDKWLAGVSGVKCDVPMDMRVRVPSGIVQLATHS